MLKKIIANTILALLLVGMSALAFNIRPAKASGTIYIRADGSINPPTAPIATVDNVTYTFTGNVDDSIVVERDSIIVDGQGYVVQGTGSREGIYLSGRSNVTIKNMEIKTFSFGIFLYDSSNNSIWGNNITANSYDGILLLSSRNNTVSENNITANSMYGLRLFSSLNNMACRNNVANNRYGIYLEEESSNNTFRDNNMTGNRFSFHVSSWPLSGYIQDVDVSNTVDGKPVYYWISKQALVVPANAGYVALVNCTYIAVENVNPKGVLLAYTVDSIITNNDMANNGYGVYLAFSSNNSIVENNMTNNEYGIWFDFPSSNNVISRNNITANTFMDIWLSRSSNNTISGNNVNNGKGILLRDSYDNNIHSNDVTDSEYGVVLWYSSTNRVYRNNIRNSRSGGVLLTYSTNNNLSENKVIASNNEGIWLEFSSENTIFGNYLENNQWGIHPWYSSNNEIYHNNFVHNTKQAWSEESINIWDSGYPSGGNYWSDYVGVDVKRGSGQNLPGSDGLGDTPYIIDLNNRDRYPLMNPWTLDTTSPSITILSPQNTTYTTSSVPLTFTVSEWAFWMGYSLDNQAKITISGNTTLTSLAEGPHSIIVYANDTSGNMGTSNRVFFTVQMLPPRPVGGYSVAINAYVTAEPLTPYLTLIAIITISFTTISRKTHKKQNNPPKHT